MKKITLLTVVLLLTALVQLTAPPVQAEVSIPDANLAATIRETLGLPTDAAITAHAMRNLTRLDARGKGITALTGLEHATNLTELHLSGTWVDGKWHTNPTISDVSPLAALTQLTWLDLTDTAVSDVSPLAALTHLRRLGLWRTGVSDVSPLANLTQLTSLGLGSTGVSDVSPLAALTQLTSLALPRTAVSDVSPLANLTQLTGLHLWGTAVSDVSPLANLTQLTSLNLSSTAVSDVSPLANLTQLTSLGLGSTAVSDVSLLAGLTQLTSLDLWATAVLDVSPLAGLTQLTELNLGGTAVSDVSPLAGLTQLTSLFLGYTAVSDISPLTALTLLVELNLSDCPLNAAAHQTHLPTIQANGTEVTFSPFKPIHLQQVPWLVSLIYFRPSDRPVRPNVDAEIDALIKKAQRFFADQLELHGFGRKTFQFETDAHGNAVVHHVNGKFPNAHYQQNGSASYAREIHEQTYIPARSITVHMLDSTPGTSFTGHAGIGGGWNSGGFASIDSWNWRVLAHELAHACGLTHDWRTDAKAKRIKTFTGDSMLTSFCAAEWLSVHPAFNPGQPVSTSEATIKMLPPTLASPPNTIRLRFEVTDPDGLHQAQLQIRDFGHSIRYGALIDCKPLNGHDNTVEFVTTQLTPQIEEVTLSVIDARGGMSRNTFDINVPSADVNGDGVVDLADLAIVSQFVAQTMGKPVENPQADVNGDGVVDGEDFALVAANLGEGEAAAPSQAALPAGLTLEKVEWALNLLHAENTGSPAFRRGIAKLEGFLALLIPDKTLLLANYPNPFNPETWIPYQLANPAEVTVTIYAVNGAVVRKLDLGHQRAGSYASRHRAAYWDGQNEIGERVASGVYFYTLSAGDFAATRKMLILK